MARPSLAASAVERRDDFQLFLKKTAVVLLLLFLWAIRTVLVLLLISAVLAAGIAPLVRRVRVLLRHLTRRRIGRGPAVLLVYLPFLAVVGLVLVFGVPYLMSESEQMLRDLPRMLDAKLLAPLSKYVPVHELRSAIAQPGGLFAKLPMLDVVKHGIALVTATLSVLFLVFYLLVDAERLQNLLLLMMPPATRGKRRAMLIRMGRRMSSWLSAQLLLAGIIGAATFVGLLALRVPYALPLAVIAAVGEIIPVIGPVIGAIPALLVALFQSPWQFWSVVALAILIQQVENLILVPRLLGQKLHVSPLGIFIAFMIGALLLGIIGALIAAPVAAAAQVAFAEFFVKRRERRHDPDRAGALSADPVEPGSGG